MAGNTKIETDDLYYCAINVESVNFSFGEGWDDTWETVELPYVVCTARCDFVGSDGSCEDGDKCPNCGGYLEQPSCAPMMNYYYPLLDYQGDRDPEEDQMLLYHSAANVVIVRIINEGEAITYALALTGGGMDLSWDICLAYVLLGYYPPMHFCDLPELAGQDNKREPRWSVLKACLKTTEAMLQRAVRRKDTLLRLVETALECPQCHHAANHNRIGGCEYVALQARCPCLAHPEGRPADADDVQALGRKEDDS